jgi:hypothetical protein
MSAADLTLDQKSGRDYVSGTSGNRDLLGLVFGWCREQGRFHFRSSADRRIKPNHSFEDFPWSPQAYSPKLFETVF